MSDQSLKKGIICSCEKILSEFCLNKLTWTHDKPRKFVESEWRGVSSKLFSAYRVVVAIGIFIWMIYDMVHESITRYIHMPAYWFLFATNWAFFLFVLTNIYLAILCIIFNFRREHSEPIRGYGIAWLLYEISTNCVIVTSLVFWFDFATLSSYPLFESTSSQVKHTLNACLVVLDLVLSAVPYRLVHFLYPFLAGIMYAFFNFLYWMFGGPTPIRKVGRSIIYPEIDWNQPGTSIGIIFLIFLVCLVVHCLLYALYTLRHFIASAVCMRLEEHVDESEAILRSGESGYSTISVPKTEGIVP